MPERTAFRAARATALAAVFALSVACSAADKSDAAGSRGALGAANGRGAPSAAPATRGTFVDGDERSTWTLTTAADGSTSIEDQARFGDDGQANRVFTFDERGTLVRATEQRTQTVQAGDRSPMPMRTELFVDFSKGAPAARKMVDGAPREVQSFEIDNIRRRADALRAQAHR